MERQLINPQILTDIANAIRAEKGTTDPIKPIDMAELIHPTTPPPSIQYYSDLVYEYYGINKNEYPYFVLKAPGANYNGANRIVFAKSNVFSETENSNILNWEYDKAIQIGNKGNQYSNGFSTASEALDFMKEKILPTATHTEYDATITAIDVRAWTPGVAYIATNCFEEIAQYLNTYNMVNMNVEVANA